MEKSLNFTIICNDEKYLNEVIEWYNVNYKTDFKVIGITLDEVNFANVEVTRFMPSDLFNLGYQFGVKEQLLRAQGKIDW